MFAQIIVDIPAKETDRPFDYIVPEHLADAIEIGSRVAVPFGPRLLQGFVVGLSEQSGMANGRIREIGQLSDLHPPLTPELVELAGWISRRYACRAITALTAMIPGALKAKAERLLQTAPGAEGVGAGQGTLELPAERELLAFLRQREPIALEALLERYPGAAGTVKELIRSGRIEETYQVKDRLAKKKVLTVLPPDDPSVLERGLHELSVQAKRQRDVLEYLLARPEPVQLSHLLTELNLSAGTVRSLSDKGLLKLEEVEVFRDPYAGRSFRRTEPLALTEGQRRVFERIVEPIRQHRHETFLLHGVTGSGKTEVYLQAIQECLEQGREAIVLVPEISLTPQMVERFKGRFGELVAVLHSRLSQGERYDEWRKIQLRQVKVAIGARSAVFAPFTRLGLIIIDEEHEGSYKQEESPKYHARDVAIRRALTHQAPVILGSATPSLESWHQTMPAAAAAAAAVAEEAGELGDELQRPFTLLSMSSRVEGRPLPAVHIVDMREELKNGNRTMFSRPLHEAIADRLAKGEQTILLLNRRGYSTFVMCRTCGYVLNCPHCDISLTYHQHSRTVRCHYCGYAESEPKTCPSCDSEHIRFFGTGTQRVEEQLSRHFPGIRVIRMDVDTTSQKGSHEKWLNLFRDGKADVLLGTQMVAKGLDFPNVTLVGAIAADTVLNLPDFRAGERTFQLLTQVAGRAGRHQLPGEVYIQTYHPEHYSIVNASMHDYLSFAGQELEQRFERGYPPYCKLILVTLSHPAVQVLVKAGEMLASLLRADAERFEREREQRPRARRESSCDVLGPIASPIPRIKDRYRFQCMIKYRGEQMVQSVARAASKVEEAMKQPDLQISIDVEPHMLL